MAKITISDLTAAFASTTALNAKFQQIEDEFNNKVVYRDEAGSMSVDLDLGGNNLLNAVIDPSTTLIDAGNVVVTPAGNIAATDAQAALEELDAEKALLAGDSTQAFDTANLGVTGNITVSGTVDGRDVATDGTKLDTVESGADITDTTNVNAAGAVMHTDVSEAEGLIRKTGSETYVALKTNYTATAAPSSGDNFAAGYGIGSPWIDRVLNDVYTCVGDGLWIQAGTSTPGGVTSVATSVGGLTVGGTASVPSIDISGTYGTPAASQILTLDASFNINTGTRIKIDATGSTAFETSSDLTSGYGGRFSNTGTTGNSFGIYGTTGSNNGTAILGEATNGAVGINYGVRGSSSGTQGVGVSGFANGASGVGGRFQGTLHDLVADNLTARSTNANLELSGNGTGRVIIPHRGCLVYPTSNGALPNGAATPIPCDTQAYDTDNIHDTVTNNTRLTIPVGVTKVRFNGQATVDNSSGRLQLAIRKAGSTNYIGCPIFEKNADSSTDVMNISSGVIPVVAGEYFELTIFHNQGVATNYIGTASGHNTWIAMEIVE